MTANLHELPETTARVVDNIRLAVLEGDSFRKVSLSDPAPTAEDIKRVILPFDNERRSPMAKMKAALARALAEKLTDEVNRDTSIIGIENALSVSGGAIITANHYAPTDSTPIRIMSAICNRRKKLHIVVQESNIFMTGLFGFLMKNCNTHPVSGNLKYMAKSLKPSLEKIVSDGGFVLIYPEQEMWLNYKKPRAMRDGAFHYASVFGVPIIPTFTEMRTLPGKRGEEGFLPVKHILHVFPPIYPDSTLSPAEDRARMARLDFEYKKAAYEQAYGIPLTQDFDPLRDIAGISPDEE
ncbi:MAG: 1-acyl-sn-glycerol-3-phosphate acyltransferase [Clostridia bacterium]|nr:1-acyl-sn-glycerol-3-phosphate acyltransferase [Clostridia bacterium]